MRLGVASGVQIRAFRGLDSPYRSGLATLGAKAALVPLGSRYGDCVSPRAMAMRGLADEMNAIGDMKAAGFIDSPTKRDKSSFGAKATASALGQPTPRALMTAAPGGGSAGSADITVFCARA